MARPQRTYESGGQTLTHHALTQTVSVEGWDKIKHLLVPPSGLLADPWKHAMTALAEFGKQSGQRTAPVYHASRERKGRKSGQLRERIGVAIHKKAFPMWAAVRSRGVTRTKKYPKGFPYPRLLNYSPRHRHTGWFDRGVIEPVMAQADAILDQAGKAIQQSWRE